MNTTSTAETKGFAKVTSDVGVVDDLSDEFCYELMIDNFLETCYTVRADL